ncbi:MAG TPA: hypothetical protein VI357_20545 [Mycobacteriales bacterium]
MEVDASLGVLVGAVLANGVLVGATLDQSIKQLPARRKIGVSAYSAYSQAADLGNGIPWYASLGVGGGLLTLAAGAIGLSDSPEGQRTVALWAMILLTLAHSAVTGRAAPTNFSQRRAENDDALTRIFNRFERLQTARAALQVATLAAAAWALIETIAEG